MEPAFVARRSACDANAPPLGVDPEEILAVHRGQLRAAYLLARVLDRDICSAAPSRCSGQPADARGATIDAYV